MKSQLIGYEVRVTLHKIYSTDGIELDSILFEPPKKARKIVIHIHGKEGHFIQNHFVTVLGKTLPNYGYAFLTFNNRGHDYMADLIRKTTSGFKFEQGGSMFDIIEECSADIEGVINYVRELGYEEIILEGHSLGPHKICYFLAQKPQSAVQKIILLSAGDVLYLLDSYVKNWKNYSATAKKMVEKGKGNEIMPVKLWSDCPVSAKTFLNYTHEGSNFWIFNETHPEEAFRNFNKVKIPILAVHPENDFGIGVSSVKAIEMMKEKSISSDFTGAVIANAIHNYLGKEEELADIIGKWLNS